MANGFLEVIEVRPCRPGLVGACAAVLVPLAMVAVATAELPPGWRAPGLVWAGLAGAAALRAERGRGVRRALLGQDGAWTLVPRDGGRVAALLVRAWGTSLGPVMGLEWRCADGRLWHAWITRRDARGAHWRRLRVRLRLA